MNLFFLQTADLSYRPLLELTSQTVREYCAKHGCSYEYYFGIIRGYHPWHATYNRIPLLKRLLDTGYTGWACYLDADAYVADLNFDLREYLSDKGNLAFIAATDRPLDPNRPYWLVNAGVFFVNLGNPTGQEIVQQWFKQFSAITDQQLQDAVEWGHIINDQDMLQLILRDLPGAKASSITLSGEPILINYNHGIFIRQILREGMNFRERVDRVRSETNRVLGLSRQQATCDDPLPVELVRALYRVLLLREPDPDGFDRQLEWIRVGTSMEDIIRSFLRSPEFRQKHEFIESYLMPNPLTSLYATGPRHPIAARTPSKAPIDNLTILANKYGSDKGTKCGSPPHKYTYLYDLILDTYRNNTVNFLELGLAIGGPEVGGPVDRHTSSPSVQMWLEYFSCAHIYGFDISDFSHINHSRFTFIRGDGGSAADMERLADVASGFDIIIDDGSHASYHQQLAFRYLFPKLRPGGTYIIEDLQWQSPTYEGKPILLPKSRDFMISFFEGGEYLQNELLSEDFMHLVRNSLASYAWFPAFNGAASDPKLLVLRKAG